MWLSRRLTEKRISTSAELGQVTRSGKQLTTAGTAEVRNIPMLVPYGVEGMPPKGENTMMIPCAQGAVCAGIIVNQMDVAEGEVRVFSMGGAEIRLKNNGDVVINGMVIDKTGRIQAASETEV